MSAILAVVGQVRSWTDVTNFDKFVEDHDEPQADTSGWDKDF